MKATRTDWNSLATALILGVAVGIAAVTGCGGDDEDNTTTEKPGPNTLQSRKVTAAPVLDGNGNDAAWKDAHPLEFITSGGANSSVLDVSMKSVYAADMVYFLVEWTDPTESQRRAPWVKQADGSWQQLKDGPSGDDNKYYEDKLALIWNINDSIAGFNQAGCQVVCHIGEGKPYGNKYTASAGERGDIWHWKSIRTGPVGQVDDQWLDDTRYDPDKAKDAGRKSDPNTGGGYKDNKTADGKLPAYGAKAPPYWILDSEKKPFNDADYKAGDEIPGMIVAPYQGDRGDIAAKGVYAGGQWTLEIGRKLTTGSEYDVQFSDLSKSYHFGLATFDNAQVRHGASSGAFDLQFSN